MIRVLIAGEGNNELGSPSGREGGAGTGVIEELMIKVRRGGFEICFRKQWKDAHKLKVGVHDAIGAEERAIRALTLFAAERGCNALVFLRDRDWQRARERTIHKAIELEQKRRPRLKIAGGVPIEMLESWLLALKGEEGSELEHQPASALEERHGIPSKRTTAMVALVQNAQLLSAPADAASLWRWLRRVAVALNVTIPGEWP